MYRGYIFIHTRNLVENGGMIVARSKEVELAGSTGGNTAVSHSLTHPLTHPLTSLVLSMQLQSASGFVPQSPRLSSPAPHRSGAGIILNG